jgi:hypothetical protein
VTLDLDELRSELRRRGVRVTLADMLRASDAARFLGKMPKTLRNWRALGTGPTYTSIGGTVYYHLADLADLVNSGRDRPTRPGTARNNLARNRKDGDDGSMYLNTATSRIETRLPRPVAEVIRRLAKSQSTTPSRLLEDALRSYPPFIQAMKPREEGEELNDKKDF